MPENLVALRNISFNRGDRVIFDAINMDVQRGKITAVLGPSGTGKTTLLKLIGAQIYPDNGNVLFDKLDIHHLSRQELYKTRQRMGMLFQSGALFTNLSAFENVAFPLREHTQLSQSVIRDLVLLKLEAVGLRGARDLMPSELSGGMARRVALARAIALDPQLIMYDEPFTGQDPIGIGVLVKLIRTLNDALGMTSIVVSHDVQEVFSIADYVYVLSNGKIVGYGTPTELQNTDSPAVKQFIKGLPDGVVPYHYPAPDFKTDFL
ncbi:MAG: ATP-binding cassette domain-containing protein [Gammaproteobacteria bacterium]|nr:ATP-binding cassette domain-containing protein [Gammaproteobacteria bacterium]